MSPNTFRFHTLPSVFLDLERDPCETTNCAADSTYLPQMLECAQKLVSWRMVNDERTLTAMRVGPNGVVERSRGRWGDHVRSLSEEFGRH